jgi:hypothetical protein
MARAWVLRNGGHPPSNSSEPQVIAEKSGDFLVMTDPDRGIGYIIGIDDEGVKWRYRETLIGTILAHSHGGWEPYEGKLTVDEALRGAKSQVPMRAVTQYEWTDDGWSPVAVYLFTREMVIGRACEGRPDITAWVEAVRASARWSPGQNLQDLAAQMCEQLSHQEYGSLYEEVEPAPSLGLLAAREFAGLKAPLPVVELSEAATSAPSMTWTPGNLDYLTRNEGEVVDQASGLNPERAGGSAPRPASDRAAEPMCPACGSSHIARHLYGEPARILSRFSHHLSPVRPGTFP